MARPLIDRPVPVPARPVPAPARPVVAKARPDPRPLRFMFGLAGIAALSAMATSVVTPRPSDASVAQVAVVDPTARPVQHVTKFVKLAAGQTAPPQAAVKQLPAPAPRVIVVATTKQSGKP